MRVLFSALAMMAVISVPANMWGQSSGDDSGAAPAAVANPVDDTSPLTAVGKVKFQTLSLLKPTSLASTAFSSAINQWRDVPHAWGQGAEGYAKRFGSAEGFATAHNTVALSLDLALHVDPRYHRLPEAPAKARVWNAVSQTLIARLDSGGTMINVPEIAGSFGAGFISNTWQPANFNTPQDAVTRALFSLAFHTGRNVAREFLPDAIKRFRHRHAKADSEKTDSAR